MGTPSGPTDSRRMRTSPSAGAALRKRALKLSLSIDDERESGLELVKDADALKIGLVYDPSELLRISLSMGPFWERRMRVGVREGPGIGCDDVAVKIFRCNAPRRPLTTLNEVSPSKDMVDCLRVRFVSMSPTRDSLDLVRFLSHGLSREVT